MKKVLGITVSLAMTLSLFGSVAFAAPKSAYVDGTYKATYDYVDGHGWKPQISLTVKGGKITAVKYDAVNPQGKLKTSDANYREAMKKVKGTYPALYSAKLDTSLVKTQDISKVDSVSGATTSSTEFKALATAAMAHAAKGDKTAAVLTMDDTYTYTADKFDSHGWKATASVTYKDGKLVKVDFDYLDKNNKKKSQDIAYNTSMKKASKNGMDDTTAIKQLDDQYLSQGKVDSVTGATSTSKEFVQAVEEAKELRK